MKVGEKPQVVISLWKFFIGGKSRAFSSSTTHHRISNHYESLNLKPGASSEEIKKQFYALSKLHHPDRNLDNPHAAEQFIKISSAYAVLGNTPSRQQYDKDNTWPQEYTTQNESRGSFSSAQTPHGARPGSGLSRRQTHFKGPPPSFYRNGSWGAHATDRQARADTIRERLSRSSTQKVDDHGWWEYESNEIPHFDRVRHQATQQRYERRRERLSRDRARPNDGDQSSTFASFLIVGGLLTVAFSPLWFGAF